MLNTVYSLTQLPSTDGNFVSTINNATKEQIQEAISIMEKRDGKDKGRILACKRQLRRVKK